MDWRGWARLAAVGWLASAAVFLWQASIHTQTIDVVLRAIAGVLLVAYGAWLLVRPDRSNVRYLATAAGLCLAYAAASALLTPGLQAWEAVPFAAAALGLLAFQGARSAGLIPSRRSSGSGT